MPDFTDNSTGLSCLQYRYNGAVSPPSGGTAYYHSKELAEHLVVRWRITFGPCKGSVVKDLLMN